MNAKKLMLIALIALSMLFVLPADETEEAVLDETAETAVTVDEEAPATFSLTASYANSEATDVRLVLVPADEEEEPVVLEMTKEEDKWTCALELPLPMDGNTYYFEVSTDDGETWTKTGEMKLGGGISPLFLEPIADPFMEFRQIMDDMRPRRPMGPFCRMPRPRRPVLVWL